MKLKRNIIITSILFVLFSIFTILVKVIDRSNSGIEYTAIGFTKINIYFRNLLPYNEKAYIISELCGMFAILTAVTFFIMGVIELIKRKKIKDVDIEILLIGSFYILILLLYLTFEFVVINYRPILINDEVKASYPSSHIVLVSTFISGALLIGNKYIKNKNLYKSLTIIGIFIITVTIISRALSGYHYFTDLVGGIILSSALIMLFYTVYSYIKNRTEN